MASLSVNYGFDSTDCISDTNGNILFYSAGTTIWNKKSNRGFQEEDGDGDVVALIPVI